MSAGHCEQFSKELPMPYNEIEILPSYYFDERPLNYKELDDLIKNNNISIIVELRSFLGASAVHMADYIPPYGKIFCVDPWSEKTELHNAEGENVLYFPPALYRQFLSNVIQAGSTDKIIPVRMTSQNAAKTLTVFPHLVFVNSSHDEKCVYPDIKNWYAKLAEKGIICGDGWINPKIQRSVIRYAKENNIAINSSGNFWSFPPKRTVIKNEVKLRQTPWLTEDAIAFLEAFLYQRPDAKILEFGTGSSTLWLAKRTKNLTSIEHDQNWFAAITQKLEKENLLKNVNYIIYPRPYYSLCDYLPDNNYDLIIVDGRNRKGCIANAIKLLKSGGILMLDNAERPYYQDVFSLMSQWPMFITEQTKPDKENFWYRGWITRWWVKP